MTHCSLTEICACCWGIRCLIFRICYTPNDCHYHENCRSSVLVYYSVWTIGCEILPSCFLNQGETSYSAISGSLGSVATRRPPASILHIPGKAATSHTVLCIESQVCCWKLTPIFAVFISLAYKVGFWRRGNTWEYWKFPEVGAPCSPPTSYLSPFCIHWASSGSTDTTTQGQGEECYSEVSKPKSSSASSFYYSSF